MRVELSSIDKIKRDLGVNFQESDTLLLNNLFTEVSSIASNISNLEPTDTRLYPYIKKAVKAEYLARGAEGLKSRGEGSISSSYEDILERLRNDIVQAGLRRVF